MQPDPASRRHLIDQTEDLRHRGRPHRSTLIERDRGLIERVERVIGRRTFPLPRHCRPFVVDRGFEIFGDRGLHSGSRGLLTLGKMVQGRDRPSFLRDGVLGLAELFPNCDDDEGEQHGINHAHRREFEAGDLVVPDELVDANPSTDGQLRRHRDRSRDDDDQQDQLPKRKARQKIRHAHLQAAQNHGRCYSRANHNT